MGLLRKLLCRPKKTPVAPSALAPEVPEKAPESITTPKSRRKPVASISSESLEVSPKQTPLPIPAPSPPNAPANDRTIVPAPVIPNPVLNAPQVGLPPPFNPSPDTRANDCNDVNGGLGLEACDTAKEISVEKRDVNGDGNVDCKDETAYDVSLSTGGPSATGPAKIGDTGPATFAGPTPSSGGDNGYSSFRGDVGHGGASSGGDTGGGGGRGDNGGGSSAD